MLLGPGIATHNPKIVISHYDVLVALLLHFFPFTTLLCVTHSNMYSQIIYVYLHPILPFCLLRVKDVPEGKYTQYNFQCPGFYNRVLISFISLLVSLSHFALFVRILAPIFIQFSFLSRFKRWMRKKKLEFTT